MYIKASRLCSAGVFLLTSIFLVLAIKRNYFHSTKFDSTLPAGGHSLRAHETLLEQVLEQKMSAIRIPSVAEHTASVIFMHGLGDSGSGWRFLADQYRGMKKLDHVAFIFPNAPTQKVTLVSKSLLSLSKRSH